MENDAMKLIYMYVYENELFNEIEINFTNEYKISLDSETKTKIRIEKNQDYEDYRNTLYCDYIQSISALVGKNGTGKTTILNLIGMHDVESWIYYEDISYFLIYRKGNAWYLETKEGNEKIKFLQDRDIMIHDRHWQRAEYDEENEKFAYQYDKSNQMVCLTENERYGKAAETINQFIREGYENVVYFYYKDNSANLTAWAKTYGNMSEDDRVDDLESTIERKEIQNAIYDIYYFLTHKTELIQEVLKGRGDIGASLILKTEKGNGIWWKEYSEDEQRKTFIVQMLFNFCVIELRGKKFEALERIREELTIKDPLTRPEIGKYEYYKKALIDLLMENYESKREKINELVWRLENINNSYFQLKDTTQLKYGNVSMNGLRFSTSDEYDQNLYELLECVSTLWDGYSKFRWFEYQYDCLSAGEVKCIDIFAGVYQSVKRNEEYLKNKNVILLLDEPDKGMHPELSRNFISILNDFSEELGKQSGCTFQYIITTHSPFLVLDVPGINVFHIEKSGGKTHVSKRDDGIMSNMIDLIQDTFFLKSTFGVLSERYFKKLQEEILGLKGEVSEENIMRIRKRIEIINERPLREYLDAKLESRIEKSFSRDDLIVYYQRKLEELRGND